MSEATVERFKKLKRVEEQNEKERMLDELFSKFPGGGIPAGATIPRIPGSMGHQVHQLDQQPSGQQPQTTSPQSESELPSVHGTEIFCVFGGGSIVINGKETKLPVTITDPTEFQYLQNFYSIGTAGSPLRSRRV